MVVLSQRTSNRITSVASHNQAFAKYKLAQPVGSAIVPNIFGIPADPTAEWVEVMVFTKEASMRNFRFRLPAGLFCLALFVGCSASPSDPGSNPQCLSGSGASCTPQTDGPPPPTDAGTAPAPDLTPPAMSPDMTPHPANPDLASQHAPKPPGAKMLDGHWIKCQATDKGGVAPPHPGDCQATEQLLSCSGFECWWEDVTNMSPTYFKCQRLTLAVDTSIVCERI